MNEKPYLAFGVNPAVRNRRLPSRTCRLFELTEAGEEVGQKVGDVQCRESVCTSSGHQQSQLPTLKRGRNIAVDDEALYGTIVMDTNPKTSTDAGMIVVAPGATGVDLTPYHDELARLSLPGRLVARLIEMHQTRPLNRIFVMGCGRSGTWLMTGVMSTFADVCVVGDEVPVETFGILSSTQSTLVLKRAHDSFAKIREVPEEIGIAYIIRHPFDVLTSHHPNNKRRFHVLPDRWLGEMRALQFLVQTKRPRTKIVRYEDLVRDPTAVQGALGEAFDLHASVPAEDFMASFTPSPKRLAAVDCMRKIDTNAVGRYKTDPESIEHLNEIGPRLEPLLGWVGTEFAYEVSL